MSSGRCQTKQTMLNNKEEILSEVNKILEVCKSIVSSLASPEVSVNFQSQCQFLSLSTDDDDDMWWDQSDVYQVSALDDSASDSIVLDEILMPEELFPNTSSESEDEESSVADRVKMRRNNNNQSNNVNNNNKNNTVNNNNLFPKDTNPSDDYINKIVKFITISAPNNVFNIVKSKKKRRKKAAKKIHSELSSLWQHSADLFLTCPKMPSTSSPSVPRVDWEKVNKRFISNIPEPSPQPLQGCSADPEFYEHKTGRRCQPSGAVTWEIQWSKHKSSKTPFGTKPGYLTDAGVISPDSNSYQVIHGYTWSPSCGQFVLHAEFQETVGPKKKKRRKMVPR